MLRKVNEEMGGFGGLICLDWTGEAAGWRDGVWRRVRPAHAAMTGEGSPVIQYRNASRRVRDAHVSIGLHRCSC